MSYLATPTAARWLLIVGTVAATVWVASRGGPPPPPPPDPIELQFVFSTDAQGLIEDLDLTAFRGMVGDRPIEITTEAKASGEVQEGIDQIQPSVWMPASSAWVGLMETTWDVDWAPADSPSLVESPQVFAAVEPLATQIVEQNGGADWRLIEALATTDRWRGYEELDGPLDLGHSNPGSSTSGLTAAVSEFALAAGDRGLTPSSTRDERVRDRVHELELRISTYCRIVAELDPELFDVAYMQETSLIDLNLDRLEEDKPPFVALYPTDTTYVADYPLVVLQGAPWMDRDERRAASMFARWLKDRVDPEVAASHGYRMDGVEPPFVARLGQDEAVLGVDATQPVDEAIALPSGNVLKSVQLGWEAVRRRANVAIVADASRHVLGHLDETRGGVDEILTHLEEEDRVGLFTYRDGEVREDTPVGASDEEQEATISQEVESLTPQGSATMWDAVARAVEELRRLDDEERVDTVVLFGAGVDDESAAVYPEVYGAFDDAQAGGNPIRFVFVAVTDAPIPSELNQLAERFLGRAVRASALVDDDYEQIVKEYC